MTPAWMQPPNDVDRWLKNGDRSGYYPREPVAIPKPKIYLFCHPISWGRHNDVVAYALAEDGHGLGSHLSSNSDFAKHDIGLTSDWHHDIYRKHYPDGYQVVWLDDPDADAGYVAAMALNEQLFQAAQEKIK